MKEKKGFSWIEIVVILAVAAGITAIFMVQRGNLEAMARDDERKTAINAMYYALGLFYDENGYYPEVISGELLPVVEPDLWTDPEGRAIGSYQSDYQYLPANCWDKKCAEYTLRAKLEKEDVYVKKSGDVIEKTED